MQSKQGFHADKLPEIFSTGDTLLRLKAYLLASCSHPQQYVTGDMQFPIGNRDDEWFLNQAASSLGSRKFWMIPIGEGINLIVNADNIIVGILGIKIVGFGPSLSFDWIAVTDEAERALSKIRTMHVLKFTYNAGEYVDEEGFVLQISDSVDQMESNPFNWIDYCCDETVNGYRTVTAIRDANGDICQEFTVDLLNLDDKQPKLRFVR